MQKNANPSLTVAREQVPPNVNVARELAPAGVRSSPEPASAVCQVNCVYLFCGGFAPEREQAPSPQKQEPL